MFGRLKIGTKILIVTILISITIIGAIGLISDLSTRDAFEAAGFNKLTAVREMKGQQIEEYFTTITQQIRSLSQSKDVIKGIEIFNISIKNLSLELYLNEDRRQRLHEFHKNAFSQEYQKSSGGAVPEIEMKRLMEIDDIAQYLQSAYLAENSQPIGQKNELLEAMDDSYYSTQHRLLHPFFKQYLEKFGFYDIFLIDNEDGRIIYSVFKEIDFGTSLLTGPYQESNLARAFNAARVSTDPDFVAVVDFEPYVPSYSAPAAFMASPIIDDGRIVGVLAFQMPVDQINDIMTSQQAWKSVGLGLSGETYLVGADKLLRNQSRFLIEDRENYLEMIRDTGTPEETVQKINNLNNSIGLQTVDTEGTRAALAGESNTRIFPDYRGVPVLSSYRPLNLQGLNWVIMSEIDEAEAFLPFDRLRDRMIMLASVLLALTIYVSYFFSLNLTRPLRFLETSAHALAEGRLDESIEPSSNDEIGDLATSFEATRVALKQTFAEVEQQKNELEERVRDRTAELDAVLENIDYGILLMDDDLHSQMINRAFRDMWMVPDEFADSNPTMKELMYSHLPKGFYDFVPRRDFETYVNERTSAVQAGAVPLGVMDRSDGKAIQVQGIVLPGGGRMITYFDITAMKRKEEELVEVNTAAIANKERIDSILQASPDGICVIDAEGVIIMVNHSMQNLFGYSAEELTGINVKKLMPDDLADRHHKALELVVWGNEPKLMGKGSFEVRGLNKSGETFPMELSLSQIGSGQDSLFVGIIRDITERKETERELAEKETQLRLAFDSMPAGIKFIDKDLQIIAFNQQYLDVMGYPDDLIQEGGSSLDELKYQAQRGDLGAGNPDELVKKALVKHGGDETVFIEREVADGRVAAITVQNTPDGQRVTVVNDITERKQAEEAIRESETKFRTLIDNIPGIVYRGANDADWTMYFISDRVAEITGYPASDFIDNHVRSYSSIIHPDDVQIVDDAVAVGIKNDAPFVIDYRIINADGEVRWVYEKGQVTFDEKGASGTVEGTIYDNTERKQIEQQVADQLAFTESLLDAIPMPIFVKDPQAMYSACNEAYEEAFGDKREDIIGKSILDMNILSKKERIHLHEDDLNLIETGDFRREEATRKFADGKKYDVMYWRRTFNRADGSPGGMVGLLIDISDRKKSEETIRRRAMEASMLHRATQLAAESDAFDKSLQQCIDLVCELTGWPIGHVYLPAENGAPELRSATIWRLTNTKKHAEFKSVSEKAAFQKGEGLPGRIWQVGEPVWISDVTIDPNFPRKDICKQLNIHSAFGFPIEIRDEVVAVLEFFTEEVVAVDERLMETMATVGIQVGQVLERKRTADELLEARDAADEANRTKSAFLANMSHELRTPMNAILGYAEMLAEDAEEEGNDDQLADLKEIMDAGEHLLTLVNDVLDISKIEAGRMDLYLETFDLTTMIDEVATTTKALVDKNSNKMAISITDGIGEIHADVTKIRQILFNLMSNAAKFTSKGTITLFGERRSEASGDIIRLGVADDGIGIPADKLERIFEEFSQADDSTTKNFGGTGLGLALVKRFCQMMGGDIWVESTEGKGSSFILELPAVVIDVETEETAETEQEISESESGKPEIPAGGGIILVIDDDRNARDLIRRSLESEGHNVAVAEDGDEGIALAHKIKPALITLDIIMPGRDGWSVLQELKDDPDLCDVPVIMVSMIDDNKMGSALGAVDHLSKPVDRDKLKALVKRYSKKGRALVVEDDDGSREVVSRALASIGWTAVEAENGAVGIEKFGKGKFDLIILDIMMPVMDGFGFIRELRMTEKGRSVPVVVLTSKDLTKAERKELNGNVEEIFLKEESNIDELVKEIGDQLISKS